MYYTTTYHVWAICEHYCVNLHLWIVSLNPLYHVCASIIYFYLHIHVLHYHLPCVSNMWTLLCELASVNCFFKSIVPCMCIYNLFLSTYTCSTLPLTYHHVSPSVNTTVNTTLWTSICKYFLMHCTLHVNAQCKFIYIYM